MSVAVNGIQKKKSECAGVLKKKRYLWDLVVESLNTCSLCRPRVPLVVRPLVHDNRLVGIAPAPRFPCELLEVVAPPLGEAVHVHVSTLVQCKHDSEESVRHLSLVPSRRLASGRRVVLPVLPRVGRERPFHARHLALLIGAPPLVDVVWPDQTPLSLPLGKTTTLFVLDPNRAGVPVSSVLLVANRRRLVEPNHDAVPVDLLAPLLVLQRVGVTDDGARRKVQATRVVPVAPITTKWCDAPLPSRWLGSFAPRTFIQDL